MISGLLHAFRKDHLQAQNWPNFILKQRKISNFRTNFQVWFFVVFYAVKIKLSTVCCFSWQDFHNTALWILDPQHTEVVVSFWLFYTMSLWSSNMFFQIFLLAFFQNLMSTFSPDYFLSRKIGTAQEFTKQSLCMAACHLSWSTTALEAVWTQNARHWQ